MHGMRPAAHESSKPLPAAGAKGGKEHAARLDGAAKTALEHARGQLRVAAGRKVRDVGSDRKVCARVCVRSRDATVVTAQQLTPKHA